MTTQSKAQRVSEILKKTFQDSCCWNINTLAFPSSKTMSVAFLNAHATTLVYDNQDFYNSLYQVDFLLRDGIGVKIGMRSLGYGDTENLNGTDLIPKLIKKWGKKRLAIFGADDQTLSACNRKLEKNNISSAMCMAHGFYNPDHYLALIKNQKPEIVILCMGMPKQELLARTIKNQNLCPIVICGGGWADFYSGTKKRAPKWVRKLSLEWLHRLISEPKRLGKRYTFGVLKFFFIIIVSIFLCKNNTEY